MNITDQMKEELLQSHQSLEFVISHLKAAHSKASQCNPFVETMLFNMLKQVRDINYELSDIRRSVSITDVIIKK